MGVAFYGAALRSGRFPRYRSVGSRHSGPVVRLIWPTPRQPAKLALPDRHVCSSPHGEERNPSLCVLPFKCLPNCRRRQWACPHRTDCRSSGGRQSSPGRALSYRRRRSLETRSVGVGGAVDRCGNVCVGFGRGCVLRQKPLEASASVENHSR